MEIIQKGEEVIKYMTEKSEVISNTEIYKKINERITVGKDKTLVAIWGKIKLTSLMVVDKLEVIAKDTIGIVASGEFQGQSVIIDERALSVATKVALPEDLKDSTISKIAEDFIVPSEAIVGERVIRPGVQSEYVWGVEFVILHSSMIDGYIRY